MTVYEEAAQLFDRQFTFQASSAWRPPDPKRICADADANWSLPNLQRMKADLNTTKSLLNDMEPIAWRRHTTWTNRAGNVMNRVRQSAAPELLTQAWCKFFQLLHDYDLAGAVPLRSFHLCEAPGAFILALQHYLRSAAADVDEEDRGGSDSWTWFANTLNPYYEGNDFKSTVTDDRLIFMTLDRWYFGQDQTGDVMSPEFKVERFLETSSEGGGDAGGFHLVTADGSVDCQDDPAEQEATVAPLHAAEVVAALKLLAEGGDLVLKMFTFFERPSVTLLYLLNCVFRQVHVKKPACSKPGNSEVYVVCKSFRKEALAADHLAALTKLVAQRRAFCVSNVEDLPADFVSQVEECARYFKELQERTIRENIHWFQNDMDQPSCLRLQSVKDTVASLYVERYECKHVSQPPLPLLQGGSSFLLRCRGWNVASFSERNGHSDWWKKHVDELKKMLDTIPLANVSHKPTFHRALSDRIAPRVSWIRTGRRYGKVPGLSKFCSSALLDMALMLGLSDSIDSANDLVERLDTSNVSLVECGKDNVRSATDIANAASQLEFGTQLSVRFRETLSRFSAGMLYLLASLFKTTTVTFSDVPGTWPLWTFSDVDLDCADTLLEYFARITAVEVDAASTVLEVVPLPMLCDTKFTKFLRSINDSILNEFVSVVLATADSCQMPCD